MTPIRFVLAGVFLGLLGRATLSTAQSTEAEIAARLKGKPLYLRGFWGDADLKFNADGMLIGNSSPLSFTVTGFDFRSAHLKKDKLTLSGRRMGTEFPSTDSFDRVKLNEDITIEIALPANNDFGPALDAIFADSIRALAKSLPAPWQAYARCYLAEPVDCSAYTPLKPDKEITPPHLT